MSEIPPIAIDAEWLDRGQLSLCIVQTAPLANMMNMIANDGGRPNNVRLVRQLLVGDPQATDTGAMLTHLLPGGRPALVLMPEYSFGSGDWEELNTLVGRCGRDVVLLAGFGAVSGDVLKGWAQQGPEILENPGDLSEHARYSGAWCWVHQRGIRTSCWCFLKTDPEQDYEIPQIDGFETGRVQPLFKFNDFFLAPGICRDLLSEGWTAELKRELRIIAENEAPKPLLIAGLLLQQEPGHDLWQNAIDNLCRVDEYGGPIVVTLANHATEIVSWDETKDKWRSQSGVFCSTNLRRKQEHLAAVRKVTDRNFFGVVCRRAEPCAVGGKVRWSFEGDQGRFLWETTHSAEIDSEEIAFRVANICGADYECLHAVSRLHLPPNSETYLSTQRDSLSSFLTERKASVQSISYLLSGLEDPGKVGAFVSKEICIRLKEGSCLAKLRKGLLALLFLHHENLGDWNDEVAPGHLHGELENEHVHTLVWASPDLHANAMRRAIEAWGRELGKAPTLLVIGDPESGQLDSGLIERECRASITEADELPDRTEDYSSASDDLRRAFSCPLGKVENCYPWEDADHNDLSTMIQGLIGG